MTVLDASRILSNRLDAENVPLGSHAAMCFAVATAAMMALPPSERRRHLVGHLYALAEAAGADFYPALDQVLTVVRPGDVRRRRR